MGIAIKVSKRVHIRRLQAVGLDADDIIKLTGYPPAIVKETLAVQRPVKS